MNSKQNKQSMNTSFFRACVLAMVLTITFQNYGIAQIPKENDRIGWSSDGNLVDEDDWAATAMALAVFAETVAESDPLFTSWDKTTGVSITESQISDLGTYIEAETDPSVPTCTQTGQMQYWNGTTWITVERGSTGQVLTFINGKPSWGVMPTAGTGEVQNPKTGAIWMDRNLGASQVATSSTDYLAYGDLYQWGRASDGHQTIVWTSSTASNGAEQLNETADLSTTDTPGHGNFITNGSSPYDWRSEQNADLWQGVSGTNNPCPSGYRLPTEAEWNAERLSWSSNNSAGAFGSPLKLPVAGRRSYGSDSLDGVGSSGRYWSSTVDGANSRSLIIGSSGARMGSGTRALGFSLRCLKD